MIHKSSPSVIPTLHFPQLYYFIEFVKQEHKTLFSFEVSNIQIVVSAIWRLAFSSEIGLLCLDIHVCILR
jgi:hypothetical protein